MKTLPQVRVEGKNTTTNATAATITITTNNINNQHLCPGPGTL